MGDLTRNEGTRHNADDLASRSERGVRDGSHQADTAAAVAEGGPAFGKTAGGGGSSLPVDGIMSRARATENADVHAEALASKRESPCRSCAYHASRRRKRWRAPSTPRRAWAQVWLATNCPAPRSEERRVGQE